MSDVYHGLVFALRRLAMAGGLLLLGSAQLAAAQTLQPGSLPGEFSVSPTGAATYSIPIQVPPGVAGMGPKLALGYNSQGGLGIAGTGWSLEGLSTITRCPRTKAEDDYRGGVNFDMNDRFCLDGQRLVIVSGAYGAPGSEYRTRLETFSRITAHGSAGNGPARFLVETKGGLRMEYGATEDSRIEAQGKATVRVWALNKVTDVRGNAMTLTYLEDPSKYWYLLSRIDYGGNRVEFEYQALHNPRTSYQAGSAARPIHRLMRITTFAGAPAVYRYALRYRADSNLLEEVTLCVPNDNTCLPGTTFAYKAPTPLVNAGGGNNLLVSAESIGAVGINGDTGILYLGDWNGDGYTDPVWFDPNTGITRWFLNNGPDANGRLSFWAPPQQPIQPAQLAGEPAAGLYFGDWNGDGLTDVMWWDKRTGGNRWFVNKGGFVFEQSTNPIPMDEMRQVTSNAAIHFGDWNGDGITDVVWHEPANGYTRWYINNGNLTFGRASNPIDNSLLNSSLESVPGQLHLADWNGDGITDVLFYDPQTGANRLFFNNGYLSFNRVPDPIGAGAINGGNAASLHIADWNGDGLPDIMWRVHQSGVNRWFLNLGDGAFNSPGFDLIPTAALNQHSSALPATLVTDLNGDGIPDLFWNDPVTGTNRSFLNNGNLQFQRIDNAVGPLGINGSAGKMQAGDFNGDGILDLVWFHPPGGLNRWYLMPEGRDALPTTIASNGNTTQLTLTALTNQGIYGRDPVAGYPRVSLQIPLYAVTQVAQSNGIGGTTATQYTYAGMNAEIGTGRGFLGMRRTYARNLQTGIATLTEFRQDWPFIGMVASVETHDTTRSNGGLRRVTNTYDSTAGSNGPALFVYTLRTVEENWDLNGTALPTVATSYQFGQTPQYGNVTSIEVSTSDGSKKTTANEYWPAETTGGQWILGRLKRATVTSIKP